MQLTIGKVLLVFCFLQTLQIKTSTWAQDAREPRTSVEQTTQFNSREEGVTAKPNSVEHLASSETLDEQTTTTADIESCELDLSTETLDTCNCKEQSGATSDEAMTTATSEDETTTASNVAETAAPPEVSKPEATASTSTVKPLPTFVCEAAGNFAHPDDCRRYYNCYPIVNSTDFELVEHICPTNQAFNAEFSSCMRDLSPCSRQHAGLECLEVGSFADPQNNSTAYYRCVARLGEQSAASTTFHVFHINCGAGKIFMPQLGKCFYDLTAPQTGFNAPEFNGMPDDEQLVKAELKQWKLKEKTKLKEEKLKLKYEKKLQKELEKKANKAAKEKAKKEEKAKKGKSNYYDDDYD